MRLRPLRRERAAPDTVENQWPTGVGGLTLYGMEERQREIRALHTASTITVCQAYAPEIVLPAVRQGRFPAAWKRDCMTWVIKQRSQPTRTYAYALDRGHLRAGLSGRGSWSRDEVDEGDALGRAVGA
jgi:hypothetical protein